jgi:pilus assembly protein CpaC
MSAFAAVLLMGNAVSAVAQEPEIQKVPLTAGRSTVLMTDFDITRIAVTDPAIADGTVVQPREVLVDGKTPGTVSLIIWGTTLRRQYDIVVEPGVSTLEQRLQALFPNEQVRVTTTGDAVILGDGFQAMTCRCVSPKSPKRPHQRPRLSIYCSFRVARAASRVC